MKTKPLPPVERVRELLDYNPDTGVFTWKVKRGGKAQAGTVAGYEHVTGYWYIAIDKKYYPAHRLAWLYIHGVEPENDIDHINHQRSDNRISNLREATRSQNCANKVGTKGFIFRRGLYEVYVKVFQKRHFIGCFKTEDEAREAYAVARIKYFGEFSPA